MLAVKSIANPRNAETAGTNPKGPFPGHGKPSGQKPRARGPGSWSWSCSAGHSVGGNTTVEAPGPSGRNKGPPRLRIGRSGLVGGTPAEARHLRGQDLGRVTGTIHRECRCHGQGKPFRPTTARAAYDLRTEGFRSVRALARPTLPAQPTYAGHSGGSRLGRVGPATWP